ncbi:MAG: zinc metalloprotease HtpX, partial [Mariprofundaceae bacterium]
MRMYRARKVSEANAPELLHIVVSLARRAELSQVPTVFYIPSSTPNAFATGTGEHSVIGVTDGLLHLLDERELVAVLAHEISHLRHKDTWIMGLADMLGRLTWSLSWVGQMLLLLNLPLILIGYPVISWVGVLILVFAPHVSALLQLAMSRTREYEADIGSAALTGRPDWLVSALIKLERSNRGWERVLMPDTGGLDPSLLRTHPPTEARIRRLKDFQPVQAPIFPGGLTAPVVLPFDRVERPASRHWGGLWH